jgi:hypothetical protein
MPNPAPYDEQAREQQAPWLSAEGAPGLGSPWAALLPLTQGMGHWLAIALVGSAVLRLWRRGAPERCPAGYAGSPVASTGVAASKARPLGSLAVATAGGQPVRSTPRTAFLGCLARLRQILQELLRG